jgi:hypothetical protein
METLASFARWLEGTDLSHAVTRSPWIWPGSEALHFVGLALLFGVIAALDLRMLGMAKRLALAPLHRLVPWAMFGFGLCLVTGVTFFVGEPLQYVENGVFWLKLLFIGLAGLNVLAFYGTGVYRAVENLGPGEDAPGSAKAIAAVSLVLWLGVMFWGRMLPFIGIAF